MKLRIIRILLVVVIITVMRYTSSRNESPAPTPAPAPSSTPTPPAVVPAVMPAAKITAKPYPFSTSVVSGEKLGGKDTISKLVQDGYEVKLANADEVATFKANPAVYMAKIVDAYKTAKPCPLTTCPVMGGKLDADSYSFVYEGREFKFCCDDCLDDFEKDPAKYVKMWDDAESAAPAAK